jgi:ribonuclease P protein component
MKTLKSRKHFSRVFTCGRRTRTALVRVQSLRSNNEGDPTEVAFVAAKRLGNAVYRNKCKRLLREAARKCSLPATGYGILLFATPQTHDAHVDHVARDLAHALVKAGICPGETAGAAGTGTAAAVSAEKRREVAAGHGGSCGDGGYGGNASVASNGGSHE